MAEFALDRNLIFGAVAFQMDFVSRSELMAAIHSWTLEERKPLDQILVERGALAEDERAMLEPLVGKHLEQLSNDAQQSRADLSSLSWLKDRPTHLVEHAETSRSSIAACEDDVERASFVAGRFQILRPHARGGLGEVFVALDRDLGREVALKQIRPPYADDELSRARFVREAEVTGGLEHPGIVPVYALGSDPLGRPYYAMRFIHGESLLDAINRFHAAFPGAPATPERSLELRKLLRRLVDVCNAIEYAHSRGVLHRDIKPANIIVGTHGETLVVDWGLAKAINSANGSADALEQGPLLESVGTGPAETSPGLALGTPSFMSPEQASGAQEKIGPASDIYSLGATLYCLLAGRAAFQGAAVTDVLRAVREGDFPPPRQVNPLVPGGLEAVCLKAMALDPRDRYASPRALADDIERWMADEAVSARPEPLAERIGRWMRRRRTTVTAAAAAMLVAVVGLAAVLATEARANRELTAANGRERARFDLAMESINAFHAAVSQDLLLREPQFEPLRGKLLRGRANFRSSSRCFSKARPTAALESRWGRPMASWPSSLTGSAQRPKRWNSIVTNWACGGSWRRAATPRRGPISHGASWLLLGSKSRPAVQERPSPHYDEARRLLESLDRFAVGARQRADLAACYHRLGALLAATGRPADAMDWYRKGRAMREALARDHPETTEFRVGLADSDDAMGILFWSIGQPAQAAAAFKKAQAVFEDLAPDHGTDPEFRRRLASGYNAIAYPLHTIGKTDEALKSFEKARAILEVLVHDNPAVTEFRRQLAYSHAQLATLLWDTGRPALALEPYEKARKLLEALDEANPSVRRSPKRSGALLQSARQCLPGNRQASRGARVVRESPHPAKGPGRRQSVVRRLPLRSGRHPRKSSVL